MIQNLPGYSRVSIAMSTKLGYPEVNLPVANDRVVVTTHSPDGQFDSQFLDSHPAGYEWEASTLESRKI
jgi:hypothetical protein